MKSFITKFLIGISAAIALVAFFAAPAFASSTTINQDPQDFKTLRVSNYTASPGSEIWQSSVNSSAGQIVSVGIYYHNSGNQTANNLRVSLTPENDGSSTTHTFNVTITSDDSNTVTDSATVTLDSAQTMSFIQGGVYWYPNQECATNSNCEPVSLPSGQTGAELFTGSGLNLGDIAPGWSTQGGLTVQFQVGNGTTCTNGCNTQTGQEPSVTTNQVSNLDSNNGNATLNGYFNSNGADTTTSFQYQDNGGAWVNVGSTDRGITSGNYNYSVTGLAGGTYTYEAVATNSYGTVYGNPMTFTIYGNTTTQYCPSGYSGTYPNCYPINNTQYCPSGTTGTYPNCYTINNQVCPVNTTGYYPNCEPVVPNCGTGSWNGSVCVYPQPIQPIITNSLPSISTLGTISIGGTVAAVDGYYSTTSCPVTTYFNYGTTQSLGTTTGQVNRGIGSGSMAQSLQNLNPNTTYYYQAVGQNCSGTSTGTIQSFTTSGSTVNDTTITHYITVNTGTSSSVGGNSFIDLTIDNHRDVVQQGVVTDYDISWTNLTSTDLKNLVLEINFPSQMTITNTDRGAIEAGKSSVVYQISDLAPHQSDEMTVSGQINSGLKDGDPVVAQAVMAFQNPKTNATENAIAYDADTFSTATSALGASIFGLGFLPNSLAGWLIIILIILIIILIARHFWNRPNQAPTNMIIHNPAPQPLAPPAQTVITGAPTGEYTVYQPTPKQ